MKRKLVNWAKKEPADIWFSDEELKIDEREQRRDLILNTVCVTTVIILGALVLITQLLMLGR